MPFSCALKVLIATCPFGSGIRDASSLLDFDKALHSAAETLNGTDTSGCPSSCTSNPTCDGECLNENCHFCAQCRDCQRQEQKLRCEQEQCSDDFEHNPRRQVCSSNWHNDRCGGCDMCCEKNSCEREAIQNGWEAVCDFSNCGRCKQCPRQYTTTSTTSTTVTTTTKDPCPKSCRDAEEQVGWEYVCKTFERCNTTCPACTDGPSTTTTTTTTTKSMTFCEFWCTGETKEEQGTICKWSYEKCKSGNCRAQCDDHWKDWTPHHENGARSPDTLGSALILFGVWLFRGVQSAHEAT